MSDQQVLSAVLEIKNDVGEMRAGLRDMQRWMEAHSKEDRDAHARLAKLELHNARMRGMVTVAMAVATAVGTAIGYVIQLTVGWLRSGGTH